MHISSTRDLYGELVGEPFRETSGEDFAKDKADRRAARTRDALRQDTQMQGQKDPEAHDAHLESEAHDAHLESEVPDAIGEQESSYFIINHPVSA